jgi:predicted O-linked N-acetylglucosamine transferase (SPINDLY family)
MQNKQHAEPSARSFDAMSAIGLSEQARKAVNEAFDAMSTWRIETAKSSEKNSEQVIEKMAAAARALGWPGEIVDAIRTQMQSITKLQIEIMDQIMDAWEEQIKAPNPMRSPAAMLSKLRAFPGLSPAGTWPSSDAFPMGAMNPIQFWTQLAEQWQKASAEAMTFWAKGGRPADTGGSRRR